MIVMELTESVMDVFANIYYSIRRYFVDEFFIDTVTLIPEDARVLDVGGHKGPKRGRFDIHKHPFQIAVVNLSPRHADIICDAARLPVATGAVDAVICSEMLEHVPNPEPVLMEMARALRPGGVFLATVPFLFQIHADPEDFARYTETFWRATLTRMGLEIVEIRPQGGYHAVMAGFLHSWLLDRHKRFNRSRPWIRTIGHRSLTLVARLVRRVGVWLDDRTRDRPFHRAFTTGYGLVARKPADSI